MSKPRATKKTAKAPAPPLPAPPVRAEERVYSLEANLDRTGPSTVDEVGAFVEGHADADLVTQGTAVDTSRIDTDSARLLGEALDFYGRATRDQRANLRGVSSAMLRAMAWAAVQGHDAYLSLHIGKTAIRTTRQSRQETSTSLVDQGRGQLDQLGEALAAIAAGRPETLAEIDSASKVTNHAEGLPGALEAMVKVGGALLENPTPAMLVRLADGEAGVTTEWLGACDDLASRIRKAGITADAALPKPEVSQATVDRWDGVNLVLLRQLVRLFESGHRNDPAIPRLNPLSLRNVLGHRKAKTAASDEVPAEPKPV